MNCNIVIQKTKPLYLQFKIHLKTFVLVVVDMAGSYLILKFFN